MLRDRGDSGMVEMPPDGWLDGAAALHLTLYGFEDAAGRETALGLAAGAHAAAVTVSIDLSSVAVLDALGSVALADLLALVRPDVLFANEDEASWLEAAGGGLGGTGLLVTDVGGPVPHTSATAAPSSRSRSRDRTRRPTPQALGTPSEPASWWHRRRAQDRSPWRGPGTRRLPAACATAVKAVRLSAEVAEALACNRPVVALESTIFSTLGLPEPFNAEARRAAQQRCGAAVPCPPSVSSSMARPASACPRPRRNGCWEAGTRWPSATSARRWPLACPWA